MGKMKIFKLLFISLLFLPSWNFAQHFAPGIMAGMVTSQVDGDRLVGYQKPGFNGGMFVENNFHKNWTFSMGINYIQKGSRTIPITDSTNGSLVGRYYKLRLNYVEVPFYMRTVVKKRFMAEGGLILSYLYKAREAKDADGFMDPSPVFKRYDIPISVGIGYIINTNFNIRFHYSYSIFPIRNNPGNQTWYFNRGQYNNYLTVGLYLIPGSNKR
jgi:hypothetical protein